MNTVRTQEDSDQKLAVTAASLKYAYSKPKRPISNNMLNTYYHNIKRLILNNILLFASNLNLSESIIDSIQIWP